VSLPPSEPAEPTTSLGPVSPHRLLSMVNPVTSTDGLTALAESLGACHGPDHAARSSLINVHG